MSGTVAVIVTSYNRPRMLGEALRSIDGADQIIIADDGSDFSLGDVLLNVPLGPGTILTYLRAEPCATADRLHEPRCGKLVNNALRLAETDYVTVLCDDDLLAPGWLRMARVTLDDNPNVHMVKGDWGLFNDGELPDPEKLCTFTFVPPLTAGNFVYRLSCATEEGCWWLEDSLAVHDGPFLTRYIAVHGQGGPRPLWLATVRMLAGYRREHPKTISNNSLFGGDRYLPNTAALFAAGSME